MIGNLSHTTNNKTSLKDDIRLQRGRPTPSSTEQVQLHAHVYLPWTMFFVLNHTYHSTIGNIPTNVATWSTCNVSPFLHFLFCKPVCFNSDDSSFPIRSTEEICQFVGVSENVGHDMAFSILNTTTNTIISRHAVRLEGDPTSPNLRIDPLTTTEVVTCRRLPSVHLEDNEEDHDVTEG